MNRLLPLFEGARRRRQSQLLAAAACAVLLGACGGGGGSDTPVAAAPLPTDLIAGSQVPFSATTSSAGAYTFISGIVATGETENNEPLALGASDLSFATSETDEPDPRV